MQDVVVLMMCAALAALVTNLINVVTFRGENVDLV